MNKHILKNIAEIISGYSFRTALEKGDGSLFVLQAKNISNNSTVDEIGLDSISFQNYKSQAVVKKDDIIISSRGHFRAGVVKFGIKEIVASSSVYIIRIKNEKILPEFLEIFLNSDTGKKQIKEIAAGAVIPAILRRDLENISILIPDLETQENIIRLYFTNKALQAKLMKKIELINNINEIAINNTLTK